jgi:excisionase family DNA binding protein
MTTTGRIRLKEAAHRLGVHAETLRRWASEGMVTYWAVGRGRYMEFDPKDIEALDTSFRRDRATPPVE